MAKVVLAFGKDPEIKKLAETIVKAQEGEIAALKEWLKKRGTVVFRSRIRSRVPPNKTCP
jgi:hypothetical protein